MKRFAGSWIVIAVLLLIDFYVFQALRTVAVGWNIKTRWIVYGLYWAISILSVSFIVFLGSSNPDESHRIVRTYAFATIVGLFLAKLLASAFFAVDDLRRMIQWAVSFWVPSLQPEHNGLTEGITRSTFISWVGFAMGGGLLGSLMYGFGNKYRYHLRKVALRYDHLPEAFKGFKMVHISDIHSGSFTDKAAVQKGIDRINELDADVILFTGDLVNYSADEMQEYKDVFAVLKARHGVFATLGNHDYGFPVADSPEQRTLLQLKNADRVKEVHREMGWRTLSNDHALIEKDGSSIAILGVDNISAKANFPSFGDLAATYQRAAAVPFKVLMSHDPSHWNAEVTKSFKDIALTLSGHTHGMQFGVELPGFRWSPVKYMYKQWAGLYHEQDQKLYVNRGFGFIGYPGRVGILPEITLIELH